MANYGSAGGFTGTEESVEIKENARVNWIVFHKVEDSEGYSGVYHEG